MTTPLAPPLYAHYARSPRLQAACEAHVENLRVQGLYLPVKSVQLPLDFSAHWLMLNPFGKDAKLTLTPTLTLTLTLTLALTLTLTLTLTRQGRALRRARLQRPTPVQAAGHADEARPRQGRAAAEDERPQADGLHRQDDVVKRRRSMSRAVSAAGTGADSRAVAGRAWVLVWLVREVQA